MNIIDVTDIVLEPDTRTALHEIVADVGEEQIDAILCTPLQRGDVACFDDAVWLAYENPLWQTDHRVAYLAYNAGAGRSVIHKLP